MVSNQVSGNNMVSMGLMLDRELVYGSQTSGINPTRRNRFAERYSPTALAAAALPGLYHPSDVQLSRLHSYIFSPSYIKLLH
jgi:hypothetical protein